MSKSLSLNTIVNSEKNKNLKNNKIFSSYNLDETIKKLNDEAIKNYFLQYELYEKIIIYYRISNNNKRKFIKIFPGLREEINKLEKKYNYLKKMKTIMIFNSRTTFENLMNKINSSIIQTFVREFIALENNNLDFIGVLYATDIITNYKLKTHSYVHSSLNKFPRICLIENIPKNSKILSEDELDAYYQMIIVNNENNILGSIDVDDLSDEYDFYYNSEFEIFYLISKGSLFYILTLVISNIIGVLMSSIISKHLNMMENSLYILSITRCITDTIILIIIEDRIDLKLFYKYSIPFILLLSIICGFIFMLIFNNIDVLISTILCIFISCITMSFSISWLYRSRFIINFMIALILPEIFSPFCLYYINLLIKYLNINSSLIN